MTDTEHPHGQMVFQSHLKSPKSDEQVGVLEYSNGPVLYTLRVEIMWIRTVPSGR